MQRGHLDMRRLGELLITASDRPVGNDGMVISAPGALTIAARALNDLAVPLDQSEGDAELLREEHQDRLDEIQPRLAAYSLETFAKHLDMLRTAVSAGDAEMVGKFFSLYVFE